MKSVLILMEVFCSIAICGVQSSSRTARMEAEYYVAACAQHYRVPVALARAIAERESNWQPYAVSPKGAVGLMQLMPATAQRLGVTDRCSLDQNASGGVRYLFWLIERFHNDLRLVAAAYFAGEDVIEKRGLAYRNAAVVTYVKAIRAVYAHQMSSKPETKNTLRKRCEMNKCLSLVHPITIGFLVTTTLVCAQTELPQPRIVNLTVDPEQVLVLHVRPG